MNNKYEVQDVNFENAHFYTTLIRRMFLRKKIAGNADNNFISHLVL